MMMMNRSIHPLFKCTIKNWLTIGINWRKWLNILITIAVVICVVEFLSGLISENQKKLFPWEGCVVCRRTVVSCWAHVILGIIVWYDWCEEPPSHNCYQSRTEIWLTSLLVIIVQTFITMQQWNLYKWLENSFYPCSMDVVTTKLVVWPVTLSWSRIELIPWQY